MNPLFEAALEAQRFCSEHEFKTCVIGALAVQRWGEPRLTRDVDLTVLTDFGSEDEWIDPLMRRFEPRRDDARCFALANRVLLLRASNGVPLDIALGALPFKARLIERSSIHVFAPQVELRTCSAEDLIVLKAFANRDKDWLDIRGILERQAGAVDVALVGLELDPLVDLKEEPEIRDRLQALLDAAGA